jgi:hypothetical protein
MEPEESLSRRVGHAASSNSLRWRIVALVWNFMILLFLRSLPGISVHHSYAVHKRRTCVEIAGSRSTSNRITY